MTIELDANNLPHQNNWINAIKNEIESANINKLSDQNVYNLLYIATNKDEMANRLGLENINKLS